MHGPLAPLLADGVIDEVLTRLKSGKEADLWLVRHGQEIVAAKVYKERLSRSFRNDAVYREGRQVRNSRTQRAMDKGSRFGQRAAEEAWKAKEADALHALHAAGVRVPRPIVFYEGVLLMELVLDPFGHPAPRLVDAHVTREHAAPLYEDLRSQAVRMLCCDLIHGDLSPYNVLAGRDGPVIIDFPQVIGAAHNSQAERFFLRDLDNLRRFFEPIDRALHARAGDAREIWRAYLRRELTPDFVPSGRLEGPRPGRPQHGRTEHGRPPHGRPEQGRTEHGRTEHGRTEQGRTEHGRTEQGRTQHGRTEHGRTNRDRPAAGQPSGGRSAHGRPQDARPHGDQPGGNRAPHGRPDHRDRLERRDQHPARDRSDRVDRRDQRERSGPTRPPPGGGRGAPPVEVVRLTRLPPSSGGAPGQPKGGQGPGPGEGGPRKGLAPGEPRQGGPRQGESRQGERPAGPRGPGAGPGGRGGGHGGRGGGGHRR